jgi:hypothetical protein
MLSTDRSFRLLQNLSKEVAFLRKLEMRWPFSRAVQMQWNNVNSSLTFAEGDAGCNFSVFGRENPPKLLPIFFGLDVNSSSGQYWIAL